MINHSVSGTDRMNPTEIMSMDQELQKGGKETSGYKEVFDFWPDNEIVRNDMLDYAFEIEYFDSHLVKMLDILEKKGELENTIVIVTADNGMPFPQS